MIETRTTVKLVLVMKVDSAVWFSFYKTKDLYVLILLSTICFSAHFPQFLCGFVKLNHAPLYALYTVYGTFTL